MSRKYKHIVLFMLSSMLLTQIGHVLAETSIPAQVSSKRSDSSVTPPVTSEKSSDPSHTSDEKSKSESKATLSDASEETASSGSASSASQSTAGQKSSTTKQADTNKLQLFSTTATGGLPDAGTWQNDFKGVDNTNVLGIASQFTIFAGEIDSVTSNDVSGNFATSVLKATNTNKIGSRGISYLQGISGNLGQSVRFGGVQLNIGEYVRYENKGNEPFINGFKVISSPSGGFRQDQSGKQYIDMGTELNRLSGNAKVIADFSKDNRPDVSGPFWDRTIDASKIVANGNVKYIRLTQEEFDTGGIAKIKGIGDKQTVVITIDTSGRKDMTLGYTRFQFDNGYKNILFNFYDYRQNMPYQGQIMWHLNQTEGLYTVLAPQATVTLEQNQFKGNIVAKRYINHYMDEQSGNFPDIPVPSNKPPVKPKALLSVPNLKFGEAILHSKATPMADWDGTFTLQANKGDNVKLNVAVVDPFTNANGVKANQISWQLMHSNYQNGQVVTTAQNMTSSSAQISYWVWQDDGQGSLLNDWRYNEGNQVNDFYKISIGNLASVTDTGVYTAKLRWTIVNGPS